MIEVSNLVKTFKNGDSPIIALDTISFEIPEGQFVSITGRSGSGKSTLLYQLGLLDHPSSGMIHIDGVEVGMLSSNARTNFRLEKLGYVFQDYAVLPSLTALENVILPLLMQGKSESYANQKAAEALKRVGLESRMHNTPSQLSGGQQQRVSIARAIAHDPKILFADEPTANLDSETSDQILATFLELHKQGQTIIMVTHEPEYAKQTERIITLADGKIVSDHLNHKHA
jgi:putative ABC transport system ATP-binding protein